MKFDSFGKRLKDEREVKGLSQQGLADVVGTNKQNISAYEQGRSLPKDEILEKIIRELGVTKNYLLGIESKKSEPNHIAKLEKENAELKKEVRQLRSTLATITSAAAKVEILKKMKSKK